MVGAVSARVYRYLLTRRWGTVPAMVWIMLNPSTADAFAEDPTIRRCLIFAHREGCGGLTVVNLFALRSTDPKALTRHPDPVGPANDTFIRGHCAPAGNASRGRVGCARENRFPRARSPRDAPHDRCAVA